MTAAETLTLTLTECGMPAVIPADRLALGYHAFRRIWSQETQRPDIECPEELHIVRGDAELDALDDELRARSLAASQVIPGAGRGYVLLVGEGVDGCDVWALAHEGA